MTILYSPSLLSLKVTVVLYRVPQYSTCKSLQCIMATFATLRMRYSVELQSLHLVDKLQSFHLYTSTLRPSPRITHPFTYQSCVNTFFHPQFLQQAINISPEISHSMSCRGSARTVRSALLPLLPLPTIVSSIPALFGVIREARMRLDLSCFQLQVATRERANGFTAEEAAMECFGTRARLHGRKNLVYFTSRSSQMPWPNWSTVDVANRNQQQICFVL